MTIEKSRENQEIPEVKENQNENEKRKEHTDLPKYGRNKCVSTIERTVCLKEDTTGQLATALR